MDKSDFEKAEKRLEGNVERAERAVERRRAELLDHRRENMELRCRGDYAGKNKGCGAILRPKDVTYIRTYWYEGPYGCTDGDIWHIGEGQFNCPKCGARTRLYDLPEFNQKEHLFKNVVEASKEGPDGLMMIDPPKDNSVDY